MPCAASGCGRHGSLLSNSVNGLPAGTLSCRSLRSSSVASNGDSRGETVANALTPRRS